MAKKFLGIDIGNVRTKVVLVEPAVKQGVAWSYVFPTPFDATQTSFRKIDAKLFVNELVKVVPVNKLRNCRIAVDVPSAQITAMSLFLPEMSRSELISAAVNEAKRRMVPSHGPNHVFECHLLGERIINQIQRQEILVVRTDVLYINELVNIFRKNLDLIPVVIAPSSFAFPLLPVFRSRTLNKDMDTVLVDIGAASVTISIFREGKLSFFRNTVYGMQDIIQDLSQRLGFTEDKTVEIIREKGIPDVDFDLKDKVAVAEEIMRQKYEAGLKAKETGIEEEINLLELRMLWQAHVERILHEFRRSLSYYKEQSGGRQVEFIDFAGGGCDVRNLVKVLTEQIGGKCGIVLPFEGMQVRRDKNEPGAVFTGAVSLALSAAWKGRGAEIINFLPANLRKKELNAKRRFVVLIAGICMIAVFGLLSLQLFLSNVLIRKNLKGIEFELGRIKRVSARLKDLSLREKAFGQRLAQADSLARKNRDVLKPLFEVPKAMPPGVYLTGLKIAEGKLEIKARVYADYEEAVRIVDEFQQKLTALDFLSNVQVEPFKIDRIFPQLSEGGEGIILDRARERDFKVNADLPAQQP
ncbi:MAG: pilus assembly protein PilM [Candidatus Omnitrophica bacterium]|nr:pilus assembly protein PilM [Candidatus Omnitrophota bacterium]